MVGRVLFGVIADRVPLTQTLRICMAAAGVGALLFWLEPTRILALIGLVMIGFFLAPIFASLISLTPGRVGRTHADSAIGFQIAAAGLGGAIITGLVGVLAHTFGLWVIGAAIVFFALLLLVLYEVLLRAKPRAVLVPEPS